MEQYKQRWRAFLQQAIYVWGGWKLARFLLAFALVAALLAAAGYTPVAWQNAYPPEERRWLTTETLLTVFASYTVLFFLLNVAASFVYMLVMGLVGYWMGMLQQMPPLSYARACKLSLVTGIAPLIIVLVFGHVMELSFSFAGLLMVIHAGWLHTADLPPPPEPEDA